jgi:hypothetical protein
MDDDSGFTQLDPPAPKTKKVAKERTPAQKAATAKALEALHAKRKEQWEAKKKELAANEVAKKETKATPKVEVEEKKPDNSIPEWAKALEARVNAVYENKPKEKKKKKVVIEESDSDSEEEVIIRRKKKPDTPPPPPPPAPVAPENPLRKMLFRR